MIASLHAPHTRCRCPYYQGTGDYYNGTITQVTGAAFYVDTNRSVEQFEVSARTALYEAVARSRKLAMAWGTAVPRPALPVIHRASPRMVNLYRCPKRRPRLSLLARVRLVVR